MLRIIMQYSLVKLVVDGTAAQKIDNQLAKRSFPVLNWNIDGSSTTFAKNDNFVPHRLCDQPKKNENNLKECWTQLTLRMRETTRVRFPIRFLIFPFFPHVSAFKSNLPVHTYPTYIRIISVTQESSGSIGNWACVEVVIWNTIFTVQLTLAYSNLASTRFPVHSVFKNFHYGERIRVDESTVQYFY